MLVVLDTNVVVSGLMNGSGMPGKIIDLALDNRFQVAYDDRILGEYEDVLARPELHIRPTLVKAIIAHIELTGQWIAPIRLSSEGYQDPDDMPFVEVFFTSNAQALVTGNLRHFAPLIEQNLAVFTPAQFIQTFFSELSDKS
jgi:putative PIN family toxin of toxin-antitoxin system